MALLFMDSFEHYTIPDDCSKKWTNQDNAMLAVLASGRNGKGIRSATGGGRGWLIKGTAQQATLLMGFGFRCSATVNAVICSFRDPGFPQVSVALTSAGAISLLCNTGTAGQNTVVATSAGGVITAGDWYYIEAKCTLDDVNGFIECVVDGVSVVDFTGDTKRQSGSVYTLLGGVLIGCFGVLTFQDNHTFDYDDFYLADTLTGLVTDYVGDCRIACLYPDGEGATQEWTAQGGGNHYDEVKEALLDSDTTYEECTTYPKKTLYTFDDLTGVVGSIAGIQTVAATRKTNTGGAVHKHTVRSNGTDTDGDEKAFSAGSIYSYSTQIWEQDPSISADWTEARVNAVEAGIDRTA